MLAATVLLAGSAAYGADSLPLHGRAAVEFRGNSTLHAFEGKAPAVEFLVSPIDAQRWRATVEIPVASLDTGNAWRDEKMRAMFDADRFPQLRGVFSSIDPSTARPVAGAPAPSLPFELEIHGTKRTVAGTIRNWRESSDEVRFDVELSVSLASFGLEAPSTLGLVHVDDQVDLKVHAIVARDPARIR